MTEPEDRPRPAPGRWTFSLEDRSPSVRVVVADPGDEGPAEVDGQVWVQRGHEGQDFVLADGVARIGYMRLVAGEELRLLVTLDDGEWWEERLEPDAAGATLRLTRRPGPAGRVAGPAPGAAGRAERPPGRALLRRRRPGPRAQRQHAGLLVGDRQRRRAGRRRPLAPLPAARRLRAA
ncbi:MAG: hypothetical protein R3F30_11370 [Planctomycetota bacterium]